MEVTNLAVANRAVPSNRNGRFSLSVFVSYSVIMLVMLIATAVFTLFSVQVGRADNFTDIFYTNSFRGAFNWIQKLDWLGMIVQIVISTFSLFGVCLMTIRIMTSMLYLSAKGMWEEVHDLKQSGGESEKDFLGLFGMAKSWAKGKAGTGLDAIIGAVLILLPDVKKYSDFGEKSGQKFDEDVSISQYMLKIALPTIMTVFFFAMGFNGTLFQALAVTVDFMGTLADQAVSINYAGFAQDLVNSTTGYKFIFSSSGTNEGKLQQKIANDIYARIVTDVRGANSSQLYAIGQRVESYVQNNFTASKIAAACGNEGGDKSYTAVNPKVAAGLAGEYSDKYVPYITYTIDVNGASSATGAISQSVDSFIGASGSTAEDADNIVGDGGTIADMGDTGIVMAEGHRNKYIHVFIRQTTDFNGGFFSMDFDAQ